MSCTPAELSALIQIRLSSALLVQLTNSSTTATTVNTSVLESACADAIGQFELRTGFAADKDTYAHVGTLLEGVLYSLELYKGRDTNKIATHGKNFFLGCKNFFDLRYGLPACNSNLSPSQDAECSLPDADRSRNFWNQSSSRITPRETNST